MPRPDADQCFGCTLRLEQFGEYCSLGPHSTRSVIQLLDDYCAAPVGPMWHQSCVLHIFVGVLFVLPVSSTHVFCQTPASPMHSAVLSRHGARVSMMLSIQAWLQKVGWRLTMSFSGNDHRMSTACRMMWQACPLQVTPSTTCVLLRGEMAQRDYACCSRSQGCQ